MKLCKYSFTNVFLKWEKVKKILIAAYSLKLKNVICHIRNVVSTLPDILKIDFENDNVVSTLSNVVEFNVEIHNVVLTLLNVMNYNVDVHNVVSTLIWCCATLQRHINLKTMMNQSWNVCWEQSLHDIACCLKPGGQYT